MEEVADNFDAHASLLIPLPHIAGLGKPRACLTTLFQWRDNQFLLKSEFAIRNDRVGLAYWTGMKDSRGSNDFHLFPHSANHLVLYERVGKFWRIRGGYSWGGESELARPRAGHLKVVFPNRTMSTILNRSMKNRSKEEGYIGMWEHWEGDQVAVRASAIPPHRADSSHTVLIVDPTRIIGYGEGVDTFLRKTEGSNANPWSWKRLKRRTSLDHIKLRVSGTVETWHSVFGRRGFFGGVHPLRGKWMDLTEYCRIGDRKSQPPCVV